MSSQYFAQYMLNMGRLEADKVQQFLKKSVSERPELATMALWEGLLTAEEAVVLSDMKNDAAQSAAKGLLTQAQVESLSKPVPGLDVCFAQVLLDEKCLDFVGLEEAHFEYAAEDDNQLQEAVRHLAQEGMEAEIEYYSDYIEMAVHSLMRFLNAEAVIDAGSDISLENLVSRRYLLSQRISGDVNIVTGLLLDEDVLLEIACRYSQENIKAEDDMALDSVSEFINVMNGLYIVNLSQHKIEADLEEPHIGRNVSPSGSRQLVVPLITDFGSLELILATDEMIF